MSEDFTPMRKGDVVVAECTSTSTAAFGSGQTARTWTTWTVEVVAAATRDGIVRKTLRSPMSVPMAPDARTKFLRVPDAAAEGAKMWWGRAFFDLDELRREIRAAAGLTHPA